MKKGDKEAAVPGINMMNMEDKEQNQRYKL